MATTESITSSVVSRYSRAHQSTPVGGERLAVVRQVVRNHPEVPLQLAVFEEVPPLPAVRPGGMLQDQRNALPRLLVVHAVLDALDAHVAVAADRAVDLAIDVGHRAGGRLAGQRLSNEPDEPHDGALVRPDVTDFVAFDRHPAVVDAGHGGAVGSRGGRPARNRAADADIGLPGRGRRRQLAQLPVTDDGVERRFPDLHAHAGVSTRAPCA